MKTLICSLPGQKHSDRLSLQAGHQQKYLCWLRHCRISVGGGYLSVTLVLLSALTNQRNLSHSPRKAMATHCSLASTGNSQWESLFSWQSSAFNSSFSFLVHWEYIPWCSALECIEHDVNHRWQEGFLLWGERWQPFSHIKIEKCSLGHWHVW